MWAILLFHSLCRAKSRLGSVHKPPFFFKRKVSRNRGSNLGPPAYQFSETTDSLKSAFYFYRTARAYPKYGCTWQLFLNCGACGHSCTTKATGLHTCWYETLENSKGNFSESKNKGNTEIKPLQPMTRDGNFTMMIVFGSEYWRHTYDNNDINSDPNVFKISSKCLRLEVLKPTTKGKNTNSNDIKTAIRRTITWQQQTIATTTITANNNKKPPRNHNHQK